MDKKLKHLEFIQGIINRMAANSFALKGWTVLLVSALLALGASGTRRPFATLAYIPAAAFWILDAYFLRQERLFRRLYDKVRLLAEADIDFSMDTTPHGKEVQSWPRTAGSRTLLIFHGFVVIAITAVVILA